MKRLSLCLFLIVCSVTALRAADQTDDFIGHFYDDANVADYVAATDKLIDAGEATVYASIEAEKQDSKTPRIKTRNGVFMLYTLAHTPDGVLIHFSVSRAPFLPTAFGETLVGLFMERSGWPKPSHFKISENQVFHAMWLVPKSEFERVRPLLPELRAKIRETQNAKTTILRGQLRAVELKRESENAERER